MSAALAGLALAVILALLAALHVYWAAGGRWAYDGVVPVVDGKLAFEPTRGATLAVALALVVAGGLILWRLEWMGPERLVGSAAPIPVFGSWGVALVFAVRAVGDFRHVGFFKKASEGRFARLDTLVYSPLCALIALLAVWVARSP